MHDVNQKVCQRLELQNHKCESDRPDDRVYGLLHFVLEVLKFSWICSVGFIEGHAFCLYVKLTDDAGGVILTYYIPLLADAPTQGAE